MSAIMALSSYARPDETVRYLAAQKAHEACHTAERIRLVTLVVSALLAIVQSAGGVFSVQNATGLNVTELMWFLCLTASALAQLNVTHCRVRAQWSQESYDALVRSHREELF